MKIAAIVLFASVSLAGSAMASSSPYSVTLAQPVAATQDVVAGMTSFRCTANTCISVSEPYDASTVHTCRQLSHEVGQEVIAYGSASHPFDADALARCNAKD
jgi:hypothetical protein